MTDKIPRAAYDFVDKLSDRETGNPVRQYRETAARLAHENGLVPNEPDVDVLAEAMEMALRAYAVRVGDITYQMRIARVTAAFTTNLTKHDYAVCKVATDEERLIEARKLCAGVAEEFGEPGWALAYRAGDYDTDPEMIAMLAALKARDGVA